MGCKGSIGEEFTMQSVITLIHLRCHKSLLCRLVAMQPKEKLKDHISSQLCLEWYSKPKLPFNGEFYAAVDC